MAPAPDLQTLGSDWITYAGCDTNFINDCYKSYPCFPCPPSVENIFEFGVSMGMFVFALTALRIFMYAIAL
jgi:hypothetical protein